MPYLNVIANFRDTIRAEALNVKHHGILELCDKLRDSELPKVGVRLEDREGIIVNLLVINKHFIHF